MDQKFWICVAGLYLALKLFVIDYVYGRFPRVRQRHDTVLRVWLELPTDGELTKRTVRAELDRVSFSRETVVVMAVVDASILGMMDPISADLGVGGPLSIDPGVVYLFSADSGLGTFFSRS